LLQNTFIPGKKCSIAQKNPLKTGDVNDRNFAITHNYFKYMEKIKKTGRLC